MVFNARVSLCSFLLLCTVWCSQAQTPRIDSLRSAIKTPPSDTLDVKTMVQLSMALFHGGNFDTSLHLAIEARKLAEDLHFKKGIASALLASGYSYRLKGAYEASLKDLKEGLLIYESLNDNLNTGRAHNFIAQVYQALGEKDKALTHLEQATTYVEKAGHKEGLSVIYLDIGINHFDRGNYEVALEYDLKSLRMSESVNAYSKMALAMNNLGVVYERMNDKTTALEYYEKCLALTEAQNIGAKRALALINTGALYSLNSSTYKKGEAYLQEGLKIVRENGDKVYEIHALKNLGNAYAAKGSFKEAAAYYQDAVVIGREINSLELVIDPLNQLGALAMREGKFERAQKYADECMLLARKLESKAYLKELYLFQSKLDSATGDFKSAFTSYKRYAQLNDSLFNERKTAKILHLQNLYDKEKKDNELTTNVSTLQPPSEKQKPSIAFFIFVSLLVLISMVTLVSLIIKRRKSKNETVEEIAS